MVISLTFNVKVALWPGNLLAFNVKARLDAPFQALFRPLQARFLRNLLRRKWL